MQDGKLSSQLLTFNFAILNTTVWKLIRYVLNKQAYHIKNVYTLESEDCSALQAMNYHIMVAMKNEN